MNETVRIALRGALVLALFALMGVALVALTHLITRDQIAENERLALLHSLSQVIPPERYDNDLLQSRLTLPPDPLLGTTTESYAYQARHHDRVEVVILTPTTERGYNGTIDLVMAVDRSGRITGVRILRHSETPGLGDPIELRKSDWILGFNGLSLGDHDDAGWRVRKDGGQFDQFTGATITPRAVVTAIHQALRYFGLHRERLLQPVTPSPERSPDNG